MLNYPDFIVFDLDPYVYSGREARGEEPELHRRAFNRTRKLALRVREQLEGLGLATWVKTSGRTGLHLYLPIVRDLDFDAARERGGDDRAARAQRERPQGRDDRVGGASAGGARSSSTTTRTAGASRSRSPYSPRRHPAAHGLDAGRAGTSWSGSIPTDFTLHTVPDRLEAEGDPWAGILDAKQDLGARSLGAEARA